MRLALVAIRLWWLTHSSTMVSTNWAWMAGPRTVTMGSPGKMGVPSGMAHTSQENCKIPQVFQEFLAEDMFGVEVLDVLLGEGQVLQVLHQLLHAGHNGEAAVVGHLAEKHVEIANGVLEPVGKIAVGHGELVKIGEHGQVWLLKALVHHTASPVLPAKRERFLLFYYNSFPGKVHPKISFCLDIPCKFYTEDILGVFQENLVLLSKMNYCFLPSLFI